MNRSAKPFVFVVDDEPMLLELAAALLEPAGYRVETFRDPDLALETFSSSKPRPAVIITDYAMHTMTGLDLIQKCRQINPDQKIILVSGTVDEDIYLHSRVKPDRFLAKPYQAKQLLNTLASLLEAR